MAEQLSIAERIKRSQQFGSKTQAMPTVNQLAGQVGITPGTTATTAGPLATPDQRKMMGTPAQKGAKIAAAGGETQLEQAVKLRAPAAADEKTETAKRKAAALAGALGPMGDKVTQLVDAAMAGITGQKVEGAEAESGLQVKVNSAAEVIKNLKPEAQTEVADLIAKIGANPADTASLNRLNTILGRTADTAIGANEIPGLIAAAPDVVKAAAGTAVTKAVGDKITLEDIGQLGTTQEELASLLGIDPAEVPNLTITDIQNRIATIQQAEFGKAQQVEAGMSSALLSSTERAALRDVLATMEETGLAGAEFQVGQIGKDIAEGRQVTVGNEVYSVEELLSSPAMTDIVKQVLDDPEAKTDFVKALKETDPDLYNWVIGSKAGLEKLVSEAATGAGKYKATQQANIKLLEPLAKFKDAFAKAGVNISALRDVNLTEEVTLPDGSKGQRWQLPENKEDPSKGGLPALAKAVLTAPPEKQATIATNISQLPPKEVAGLDAGQLAALGLDSPTGLWSDWKRAADIQAAVASIPDNQPARIFNTLGLGDFDQANAILADAILSSSFGGPTHPVLELDANKDGKLDEKDMPALKERAKGGGLPSLQQIITAGKVTTPKLLNPDTPLNYGNATIQRVTDIMRDGTVSPEEAESLLANDITLEALEEISKRPGIDGMGNLAPSLNEAIRRKVDNVISADFKAAGIDRNIFDTIANLVIPEPSNLRRDAEWNNIDSQMVAARNAESQLKRLIESTSNPGIRQYYSNALGRIQSSIQTKQQAIDAFNAEFSRTGPGSGSKGGNVVSQAISDIGGSVSKGTKRLLGKGLL